MGRAFASGLAGAWLAFAAISGCSTLDGLTGGGGAIDAGDASLDAQATRDAGSDGDIDAQGTDSGCTPACGSVFESCEAGKCVCGPSTVRCGATCVDTKDDPTHCGGCGVVCSIGGSCVNGACKCPAGDTCCMGTGGKVCDAGIGGVCESPGSPRNCAVACGGCSTSSYFCVSNACQAGACNSNETYCDTPLGAGCVVTTSNPAYCGSCKQCAAGELCIQGACQAYRPAANCTGCPCKDACEELEGTNNSCCILQTGAPPFCVHGGQCP